MTPTPAMLPKMELGILISSQSQTATQLPCPPTTSTRMFSRCALRSTVLAQRSYATLTTPNTLILLEHKADAIVPATLNAITAAKKLGGNLTALIVGEEAETKAVVEKAKK